MTAPADPVTYLCCFCGEGMASAASDLRYLSLTCVVDAGRQELFVHARCLRERVRTSLPLLGDPEAVADRGTSGGPSP